MLLKVQVAGWSQTALEGLPSMGLGSCPSTTAQWLKRHMVYITFFFLTKGFMLMQIFDDLEKNNKTTT